MRRFKPKKKRFLGAGYTLFLMTKYYVYLFLAQARTIEDITIQEG